MKSIAFLLTLLTVMILVTGCSFSIGMTGDCKGITEQKAQSKEITME